ncbi:MAG: hypothetical protein H6623_09120 [Bdellovibrionaceae bacterium]|nr:hypothetical protein [Pseudobdellovibrionaceae bacterium]
MSKFFIFLTSLLFISSSQAVDFLKLFPNKKPIIAAIMVEHLEKDSYKKTEAWLLDQARIASQGNMDAMLIEFRGGGILSRDIPNWELEMMSQLLKKVIAEFPDLVIGEEILWHFPGSTIKLAKMSGAKFVRIDFFSDDVIADGQHVPIDPKAIIKYRNQLDDTNIALLTDIQVKYSQMIDKKIPISASAQKAQSLGSDGVIVSGTKSGSSPDTDRVRLARKGVDGLPVVIGSGFSVDNAKDILPLVDAVIVGTSISVKTGGPLLPEKIKTLMSYVRDYRKKSM